MKPLVIVIGFLTLVMIAASLPIPQESGVTVASPPAGATLNLGEPILPMPTYGTMVSAEKMTDEEIKQLNDARTKVNSAIVEQQKVEGAIAGHHKMGTEHYMEWSRWYEFDGDWIVQRFESHMNRSVITLTGKK